MCASDKFEFFLSQSEASSSIGIVIVKLGPLALFHGLVVALEVTPGERLALAEQLKCPLTILHEFEVPRRILRVLLAELLQGEVDLMVRLIVLGKGLVGPLELGQVHHALSIAVSVHNSNLLCFSPLHPLFFHIICLPRANVVVKLTDTLDRGADLDALLMAV